jgi:hypothetical protein
MSLYTEHFRRLQQEYPLIASIIEEVWCDALSYDQYEEEQKQLNAKIAKQDAEITRLRSQVQVLMLANGIITKKEAK